VKTEQFILILRSDRQRGASLIMVMMILIIVSLLGVGGAQIALMSERGARNDRDMQVAWQAAEAALLDAEVDMTTLSPHGRKELFDGKKRPEFKPCTDAGTGTTAGLYDFTGPTCTKPAWLSLNFTSNAATVFGANSGKTFASGNVGVQPAQAPLYMIELVKDPANLTTPPSFIYRVTAMGFGPRTDIQAVVQEIYRTGG